MSALAQAHQTGIIAKEAMLQSAMDIPCDSPIAPPIVKNDVEYVNELQRLLPSSFLNGLPFEYLGEMVRYLREKDEELSKVTTRAAELQLQLNLQTPELVNLRKLAEDLAERIRRVHEDGENKLVGDFSQDQLYDILDCGEDGLAERYAQQLQNPGEVDVPDVAPDLGERKETINVFRAKVGLVAAEEAQRQGLKYVSSSVRPGEQAGTVVAKMEFGAEPGQQLDRSRLKQMLNRHKPVGMKIEMFADVHVKVPL